MSQFVASAGGWIAERLGGNISLAEHRKSRGADMTIN
jgi:hypothetical protein